MLTKIEQCKDATISPKAQAKFVHTIANVLFIYVIGKKHKQFI